MDYLPVWKKLHIETEEDISQISHRTNKKSLDEIIDEMFAFTSKHSNIINDFQNSSCDSSIVEIKNICDESESDISPIEVTPCEKTTWNRLILKIKSLKEDWQLINSTYKSELSAFMGFIGHEMEKLIQSNLHQRQKLKNRIKLLQEENDTLHQSIFDAEQELLQMNHFLSQKVTKQNKQYIKTITRLQQQIQMLSEQILSKMNQETELKLREENIVRKEKELKSYSKNGNVGKKGQKLQKIDLHLRQLKYQLKQYRK